MSDYGEYVKLLVFDPTLETVIPRWPQYCQKLTPGVNKFKLGCNDEDEFGRNQVSEDDVNYILSDGMSSGNEENFCSVAVLFVDAVAKKLNKSLVFYDSSWSRADEFDANDEVPFRYNPHKRHLCTRPLYLFHHFRFLTFKLQESSSIWQAFACFKWSTWLSILFTLLLLYSASFVSRRPDGSTLKDELRRWLAQLWHWLPHLFGQDTTRFGHPVPHLAWILFLIVAVELFRSDLYANIVSVRQKAPVDSMSDTLSQNKTPYFPQHFQLGNFHKIENDIETFDKSLAKVYRMFYQKALKNFIKGEGLMSYEFLFSLFSSADNIDRFVQKGLLVIDEYTLLWAARIFEHLGFRLHAGAEAYGECVFVTQCFRGRFLRFERGMEKANRIDRHFFETGVHTHWHWLKTLYLSDMIGTIWNRIQDDGISSLFKLLNVDISDSFRKIREYSQLNKQYNWQPTEVDKIWSLWFLYYYGIFLSFLAFVLELLLNLIKRLTGI